MREALGLVGLDFAGDKLVARFAGGSKISMNVNRYPRLAQTTPAQRNKWQLIGKGSAIHWEGLEEDISVENLLFDSAKSAA